MTNEEAAAMLERMKNYFLPTSPMLEERREITALDLAISALSKQSASSEQADQAWEMLMGVHDMPDVPDKAKDIIGDVMLMLHQMIIRADESIITDFVAYQREQLRSHKIMELNSVDEAMTHIFIGKTGKAYIEYLDKLGQFEVKPGKKGEDRTRDDHIADSDQFRDDMKMTDSEQVALPEQEKSNSFLKEPSESSDSEMNCSDVPDIRVGKIPYKKPEIIHCESCKHWTHTPMRGYGLGKCDFHDDDLVTRYGSCGSAERRNDG